MKAPANAVAVTQYRSWITWKHDQPWRYILGFDKAGRPVRFEIKGRKRSGAEPQLAVAWRTVTGQWLGRYRQDYIYVMSPLSPTEIDFIEHKADELLSKKLRASTSTGPSQNS